MSSSTRRGWRRGQSLVEFAIVLPVLLILLAGGADLTRAFFVGIQIADGARSAALYAADNPDTFTYDLTNEQGTPPEPVAQSALSAVVAQESGFNVLTCPSADLHLTLGPQVPPPSGTNIPAGAYYQPVTVTCQLPLLTPGLPSPVTIRSTATALIVP